MSSLHHKRLSLFSFTALAFLFAWSNSFAHADPTSPVQTPPSTAASPLPEATPNASTNDSSTATTSTLSTSTATSKHVDYTPSIDIIGQSSSTTSSDARSYNGAYFDAATMRVGGKIDENISRHLDASYQHGYVDHTLGRAPNPTTAVVDDIFDDYRLNLNSNKRLNFALGYYYRHRQCCPGDNSAGNLTPSKERQAYLEANYIFPKIRFLNGGVIALNARDSLEIHHVSATAATLAANPQLSDNGTRTMPSGGASLTIPVNRKAGVSVFTSYSYQFDYFDYSPIVWWYNVVDFGFTKKFNKNFSMRFDNNNLVQHKQGYPFQGENALHRAKFVLSADLHLGRSTH